MNTKKPEHISRNKMNPRQNPEQHSKQIFYDHRGSGLAVVASNIIGDGIYPMFYKEEDGLDKRIEFELDINPRVQKILNMHKIYLPLSRPLSLLKNHASYVSRNERQKNSISNREARAIKVKTRPIIIKRYLTNKRWRK